MKKTFLTFMIFSMVLFAFAQEEEQQSALVSKKGIPILPEAGEFSIGISAVPFFEYVGNIFNNTTDNPAPGFGFTEENPMIITGKYMLDENTAIRGIFRMGFGSEKTIGNQLDDIATTTAWVEDNYKHSYTNIGIGAGYEKRRGKGRLQGIYGGQAILSIESTTDAYEYGNSYSATNLNPSRTDFGSNDQGGAWTIENKSGTGFGIQIQGFVGAEFFFAPKFSLSGEFTYGLTYKHQAKGSETIERWNVNPIITTETGGGSSFGLDTGVGAVLNLNFYF